KGRRSRRPIDCIEVVPPQQSAGCNVLAGVEGCSPEVKLRIELIEFGEIEVDFLQSLRRLGFKTNDKVFRLLLQPIQNSARKNGVGIKDKESLSQFVKDGFQFG